ncbi:MAG: RsmB/NOP family class I SAM-dependent RNA methyltransferase [Armatimonadetes bacterium]|nr:RsmB/NOP family class I SAM-dependent RNA methyltransferase [Armatimonadota bacterium]
MQRTKAMIKLADRLFAEQSDRELFLDTLCEGRSQRKAVIDFSGNLDWVQPLPACPFVKLVPDGMRVGELPEYSNGAIYPLDLSSCLTASAMVALDNAPKRILDLCAAPGGKTMFAAAQFPGASFVANEVIGKRHGMLISNLKRCNIDAEVWGVDPKEIALQHPDEFDLVIVDAPCSGQSLIARGQDAYGCFLPDTIRANARRQRRILSEAIKFVAPGGAMLYTTCTFSPEENELIIQQIIEENSDVHAVEVAHLHEFQSIFSENKCYRLYPQMGFGAGGFSGLLAKTK